ncbi:hypothetical protein GZH53_06890 [Flavihumibacter sp. R14]|nr:hypothetical protein [Flavihumibacter soli]
MRKIFTLMLLVPFLALGQNKTVLNSFRIYPKPDKVTEFNKALANHAQKYHTGDWKWRVWSIESGPESGGYMVSEGPSSWDLIDKRGDISPEHLSDWDNNVSPLTINQGTAIYLTFKPELGTAQMTDYADKIIINHMTALPGRIQAVEDLIKKQKKMWENGKESIAVYSLLASGEPGYVVVSRLRGGLKELAEGFRKPIAERYNEANGAGSFDTFLKDYAGAVQKRWSELLIYRPELSSK